MIWRKGSDSGRDVFLMVYVYDILIMATSKSDIEWTVDVLKSLYNVRHCDSLEWFWEVPVGLDRRFQWLFEVSFSFTTALSIRDTSTVQNGEMHTNIGYNDRFLLKLD